eukprot:3778518-Rhodomonas_salina.1
MVLQSVWFCTSEKDPPTPQHRRKAPLSLVADRVGIQRQMSQRLALPQHRRKRKRPLVSNAVVAQVK